MPTRKVVLHNEGPALWPGYRPLAEVLKLKALTPPTIWETTYQGNRVAGGDTTFLRDWWRGQNRYDPADRERDDWIFRRYLSLDTAETTGEKSAWTVCTVGELLTDGYLLDIREVVRERLTVPELPEWVTEIARRYYDGRLWRVLIEGKSSGRGLFQTLSASVTEPWLAERLHLWTPTTDKETRAGLASVWCRNGRVRLPRPSPLVPWLPTFEEELFTFPRSVFADQVDTLSQLIQFLEPFLEEGWRESL